MAAVSPISQLLSLPFELRLRIIEFCIPYGHIFQAQRQVLGSSDVDSSWEVSKDRIEGLLASWNDPDGVFSTFEKHDCIHSRRRHWPRPVRLPVTQQPTADQYGLLGGYQVNKWGIHYCQRCLSQITVDPAFKSAIPGLLLTCRQIRDEVEPILYGQNTFVVDLDRLPAQPLRFSPRQAELVRHLILLVGHFKVDEWDNDTFASISKSFPVGLKTLRIFICRGMHAVWSELNGGPELILDKRE